MDDATAYLLLTVVGVVAGAANVIAGGGSFLTLPLLIFLGLPAAVANGTNRVGILIQNVFATASFRRLGVVPRAFLGWAVLPSFVGAIAGTWFAVVVPDLAFRRILATLMVVVALPSLWSAPPRPETGKRPGIAAGFGFFVAGIYGGFVQAGVGFLILAVTSRAGLDLVRGNAVKVISILAYTAISLTIFAWTGLVRWDLGLALAAGTAIGGVLGARVTVARGQRFVRGAVMVLIVAFAARLWLGG